MRKILVLDDKDFVQVYTETNDPSFKHVIKKGNRAVEIKNKHIPSNLEKVKYKQGKFLK